MIPLIPTLALSILSFLSSAFTILCTVIPLIPNSRIHPRKRNHARTISFSRSDQAHAWLAIFDIFALMVFVWEVFVENLARPMNFNVAKDPASSARLLFVLTLRQICLLVVTVITIFQVRRAKPCSFRSCFWIVLVPTLAITAISTGIAGAMASVGLQTFHIGVASYSSSIAVLSTLSILYLVAALGGIRRGLVSYSETDDSWQHAIGEETSCHSFPTEDIEALKDGSSWITSDAESCRSSISAFSFDSTVRTVNAVRSANGQRGSYSDSQHDTSWLTEPSVSPPTMTEWSFPTTCTGSWAPPSTTLDVHTRLHDSRACSCPITPAFSSTQFIGGNSHNPTAVGNSNENEGSGASSKPPPRGTDVSWLRVLGWLAFIWVPLSFSLPYLFAVSSQGPMSVLFVLSITISAPMLALNVVFFPLPIPHDLYEDITNLPKPSDLESRHKRSGSITVVEGRRSGDVWLTKGDASGGKNKLSRATSLLSRVPKLSVLPVKPITPQSGSSCNIPHSTLQDDSTATSTFVAIGLYGGEEMERLSCLDGRDDSHVLSTGSGLPAPYDFITKNCPSMLSQSAIISAPASRRSSTSSRSSRGSRLHKGPFMNNLETILDVSMNTPQRYASSGCPDDEHRVVSFRAGRPHTSSEVLTVSCPLSQTHQDLITSVPLLETQGRITEIDSLSARLLPLLVPGLRIGSDIKVRKTPEKYRRSLTSSLSFSSPDLASTPPPVSSCRKGETGASSTESAFTLSVCRDAMQKKTHMPVGAVEDVLIHRVAEVHLSTSTQPKSALEYDTPDPNTLETDGVSVHWNPRSRIPRRVQASIPIESSVDPNAVDQKLNPYSSEMPLTSPSVYGEDTSRRHKRSLIPVPVRLREVDVVHVTELAGRRTPLEAGDRVFGLCVPNLSPPSKLARSASEKRRTVLRGGQR